MLYITVGPKKIGFDFHSRCSYPESIFPGATRFFQLESLTLIHLQVDSL